MPDPTRDEGFIDIVFDGPPGPEAGRFVEVENHKGESISLGEWLEDGEFWRLRIPRRSAATRDAEIEALAREIYVSAQAMSGSHFVGAKGAFRRAEDYLEFRDEWRERRGER